MIARIMGVTTRSIRRWRTMLANGGLMAKPVVGRPPKLCDEQLRRLEALLNEELCRARAREDLGTMLKELHSLPGEPMSYDEIQAEIDAVRAQRRGRASGH